MCMNFNKYNISTLYSSALPESPCRKEVYLYEMFKWLWNREGPEQTFRDMWNNVWMWNMYCQVCYEGSFTNALQKIRTCLSTRLSQKD